MRFLWAAVVLGALSGCGPAAAFECENDMDCLRGNRPQGTCEPVGYCSFPDSGCPSGQRYGEASAGFGGKCVPGGPPTGGTSTGGGDASSSSGSSSSGDASSSGVTTLEPTTGISGSGTAETGVVASTGSSSTGPGFDAELVLWLDFEAGDADKSTYNHPVSCAATCPDSTMGVYGSAALFDDDYLEVAAHPGLDFSERFTFTAWVRPDGLSNLARGTIVSQEYGAVGTMSYDVSVQDLDDNPTLDLVTASEGGGPGIPDVFEAGQWVFMAIRFEDGLQQVFVGGSEVYLGMVEVPSSQQAPVFVGGVPGIGFPFVGAIDDVRIYRRVLDDAELQTVFMGEPLE